MAARAYTLLCILLLLLAGCAAPQVRESSVPEAEPGAELPTRSAAVTGLLDQGVVAFQSGDYQGAIASAERGLRIDRRDPELYLLLARSYLALARPGQADEFARQGLRYSEPGSLPHRALEAVREQVQGSAPTLTF